MWSPASASRTTSRLVSVSAPPAASCRQRPSPGDRLQAAVVAATAEHPLGGGDLDMADVAGGALGAAVEPAPEDEAGADAGAHLDEQQVVGPG